MKAVVLTAYGPVENFELRDLPDPAPGPGQVLVRVVATSVNPVDYKIRSGAAADFGPDLPAVLGCDVAGTVVALGEGVDGFAIGDKVYGCVGGTKGSGGTYAELVVADARLLAPLPANLSFHEAAALPLVTLTGWEGVVDRARVQAGDRVLVHGGAGGVGHVAIQIAKARGAHVTATVSSPEKAAIARRLGADATVDYRAEPVAAYVDRLTGGRGFDVVFDTTGGSDLEPSFQAARLNGRVVTIVSTYSADLTTMHLKGLSLDVVFMLIPLLHDPDHIAIDRAHQGRVLREATALVEAGRLMPLIDARSFGLSDIAAAHTVVETGKALGKVVIDVQAG